MVSYRPDSEKLVKFLISLNPFCNGQWSRTRAYAAKVEADRES